LEIVGEAAARVSPSSRKHYTTIPWPEVIGLHNRLIHGYDNVDFDILWDIAHINSNPELKAQRDLLQSIPGLGERTTTILLAFYADPSRFANSRQAAAFAGLDPRQRESGTSVKAKPRLSKVGHTLLRKALYMPAMVTLYKTKWGKQFKERLTRSGKPAKLIMGAMRRKLLQVAFGVLKSGKNFDPTLYSA
jgi:hypothetical protein